MFNYRKYSVQENGFTLIEMLIVLVVMGIILSIAVLGFSGADKSATLKACQTDLLSVKAALKSFSNDYPDVAPGTLPLSNTDLYSKSAGTLANLGYMSPLIDNRNKYVISMPSVLGANPTVTTTNSAYAGIISKCV